MNEANQNDVSVRPEFYNGQDVNGFLTVSQNAQTLVKQGNYLGAKLAFIEALEGLEVLLGAPNKIVIDVLLDFVHVAIENEDFDGAMERLRRSYTDHQEMLGDKDKKTLLSLGRLGLVYDAEKKYGQALKVLSTARDGLRAACETSPEDIFNLTVDLSIRISYAHQNSGDFEAAEKEVCDLIRQAEGLGDAYREKVAYYKHLLAHLYINEDRQRKRHLWSGAAAPRQRVEKILLEAIHDFAVTFSEGTAYLCSLEQLRMYYEITGEVHKLSALIAEKIEPSLSVIRPTDDPRIELYLGLMKGTVYSLWRLREYEKADWWMCQRQQQIENLNMNGDWSFEALYNLMEHAKNYLDRGMTQLAEPMLEKAQRIARQILPPDHSVHKTIAESIANKSWTYRTCKCSLSNLPDPRLDTTR